VRNLFVCAAIAIIAGCALPETTVKSGNSQPGLIVKGAPAGSLLYVDGVVIGPASQFDGKPKVLTVGVHHVEVRQGSTTVYSEKAFVGAGESHTVTVVGGSAE
jgi:hypothetical protein